MDRLTGATDATRAATSYTYDAAGRLAAVTDRNGNTLRLAYDARGWLRALTDGSGGTWAIGRDAEGVLTGITSPLGFHLAIESDALGHPTAVTDPAGGVMRLTYDAMGRLTGRTDRAERHTSYTYDAAGRLAAVTVPGLGTATYTRNGMGRLTSIGDLRGQVGRATLTNMGRLQSHRDPLGNEWGHDLDANGRLGELHYPDGTSTTITYDAADRIVGLASSGGQTLRYVYDAAGRLVSTDGLDLAYDLRGDVVESREPVGGAEARLRATYDAGRRLASLDYDGRTTVHYEYDTRNLPLRVSDEASGAWLRFGYDADGRLVEILRSNGVLTGITHDAVGRVTGLRDTLDGRLVADQQVTLDAEGSPTLESRSLPLLPAITEQIAFTATFDAASRPSSTGCASDARGRQTSTPRGTLSYDDFDRTIGIEAGRAVVALAYNGLGMLWRRAADGVVTSYVRSYALPGFPVVAESAAGSYTRLYVRAPDGSLLYSIDPNTKDVSFYHFDRVGSTLFLTDRAGEVTDAYAYEPYGLPLGHTGTSDQPFTFIGRHGVRFEPVGGFYQMGARLYDPQAARFTTRDAVWPVPRDPRRLNPYAYAHQNPLRFIDRAGAQAEVPPDWTLEADPSLLEVLDPLIEPFFPGVMETQMLLVALPGLSLFEMYSGPLSGVGSSEASWPAGSLGSPIGGDSWRVSMLNPPPAWQPWANAFPFAGGDYGLHAGTARQSPSKADGVWPRSLLPDDWGWNSTDPFSSLGGFRADDWSGSWGDAWSLPSRPFAGPTAGGEPLWPDLGKFNTGPWPTAALAPMQLRRGAVDTSW